MALHVSPSWTMLLGNRAMQSVLEMRQMEQMEVPMKEPGNHVTLQDQLSNEKTLVVWGIQGIILLYDPILWWLYSTITRIPIKQPV